VRVRIAIASAIVALAAVLPTAASAAPKAVATMPPAPAAVSATASKVATRVYDLDFTLPTAGKSGCLVCHADPRLVKIGPDTTSTIYVEIEKLNSSAHKKDTPCTGCHLDFAYTSPHAQSASGDDWEATARLACKNCHEEAFRDYANGAHSLAGQTGKRAAATFAKRRKQGLPLYVPVCGDCHGGHAIPSSDDTAAMAAQHLTGEKMCGQCHVRESDSYSDYYHGAAYRNGSHDAPSCWDCHGFHEMLPSTDRHSPVNESNLTATCGQDGCHSDAELESGFLEYAKLIHGQQKIVDANPVVAFVGAAKRSVGDLVDAVRSWF